MPFFTTHHGEERNNESIQQIHTRAEYDYYNVIVAAYKARVALHLSIMHVHLRFSHREGPVTLFQHTALLSLH